MVQKVVLLILASNPAPLSGLLQLIDERFAVVVHLDAKAGAMPVLPGWVLSTQTRLPVFWGGFNIMLAVRELLDTAYDRYPLFRRAVLLTGDTLPLHPAATLEQALLEESRERIELTAVADDPSLRGVPMAQAERDGRGLAWRFQNRVAMDDPLTCPRSPADVASRYGIGQQTADYIRSDVERLTAGLLARMPPRPKLFDAFYYGSSWWALSRTVLDLIIDDLHATAVTTFFQDLFVPDEHQIHTLLGNKRRALLDRRWTGSPTFVDHGDPVRIQFGRDALDAAGFRRAARGSCLFARKYDPLRHPDIAAAIDQKRFFTSVLGR